MCITTNLQIKAVRHNPVTVGVMRQDNVTVHPDDLEKVRDIATALRSAMEAADFTGCAVNLQTFPNECCSHASSLLLIFLHEAGIDGFKIVKGFRPDTDTTDSGHEWVQNAETVIDITADQFAGLTLEPVIVGPSKWHAQLHGKFGADALHTFDVPYYKQQTRIYDRIVATGLIQSAD